MENAPTLLLIAIVALLGGGIAGWFLRRLFDPAEQRISDLERRLSEADTALHGYRHEVTEHFRGTAERVNRLTEDYRELHAHLSEGALGLCDASSPGSQAPLLTSLAGSSGRGGTPATAAAPLDYAPMRPRGGDSDPAEDLDLERIHEA